MTSGWPRGVPYGLVAYFRFFHSCIFHPCTFPRIAFSTPAFSLPRPTPSMHCNGTVVVVGKELA